MKWARFDAGDGPTYGIVEGAQVRVVTGDPFAGYKETGIRHDLASVRLLVPVMPQTFYAVGLNYAAHVTEAATARGEVANLPDKPDVGYRAQNALIAHGEDIVIPRDASEEVHYEGELVVVIGKRAKHLSRDAALSCVLGYTIGNDVSERTWQRSDRTFWRAKNTDTFKPMGPWIETDVDLSALETRVRVNGAETIRFATNDMIFGVAEFVAEITKCNTLHPGDVIWMGTDGKSPNLKAGDEVEVEITGIGTLRNRLAAEV